jgi:hypothetical protein
VTCCAMCGSSARLRYDRASSSWRCVGACGSNPVATRFAHPSNRRRQRPTLFCGHVLEDGQRRRANRAELAEAYRLFSKHRDLAEADRAA